MIKNIVLLFVAVLGFSSCNDIYYDAETRLVVEGRLVDKNGNAIPNQYIDVLVVEFDEFNGYNSNDIITNGSSDADGRFKFVIPGPRNATNAINVRINKFNGYNTNGYQEKQFVNIQRKDFVDYKFNINTAILYKNTDLVSLNINTMQTDEHRLISDIFIEGNLANSVVAVNPVNLLDYIPYDYYFELLKNQTVNLKYTVTDYTDINNPVPTNYVVPIQINNQNVDYTLTY